MTDLNTLLAGLRNPQAGRPAPAPEQEIDKLNNSSNSEKEQTPAAELGLDPSALTVRIGGKVRRCFNLANTRAALQQIERLPTQDESVHAIMGGDFNGWDLVPAVYVMAGKRPIERFYATTLGFNTANTTDLCAMLERGWIREAKIMVSHYFAKADPRVFSKGNADLARFGVRMVPVRNHSKVLLFAIGEDRYVVESSANLRTCNSLEQFSMFNDPALFDFHAGWIEETLTRAAQTPEGV